MEIELNIKCTLTKGTSSKGNEFYVLNLNTLERDILLSKQDIKILKLMNVIK